MSRYVEITKDGNNYVVNPKSSGNFSKLLAYGGMLEDGRIVGTVAYHTQEFTESDIGTVVTTICSSEYRRSCSISVQQLTVGWGYVIVDVQGSEDPAALGWYHSTDYGSTWELATEHVPDTSTYTYGVRVVGLTDGEMALPRTPECDVDMPSIS